MEKWPDFFIVGAPRAGTTSLYEYLKQIPEIFLPEIKEPNYFSISIDPTLLLSKPIRDKSKYLKLFESIKEEKLIGEASPTYLWDPKAPTLICQANPKSKIIIILRNPIERAFSHYLMLVGHGNITSNFMKEVKESINSKEDDYSGRIIKAGLYARQVKRYFDLFGKDNVQVLIFEEFFSNTKESLKNLLGFLNIQAEFPEISFEIFNPFTVPRGKIANSILKSNSIRSIGKKILPQSIGQTVVKKVLGKEAEKPSMSDEEKEFLRNYYFNDIKELEKILDRSLPWKDFVDKNIA